MMHGYGFDMTGWGLMGGWGAGHWITFILFAALVIYPVGLILKRLGYSPLWSIVAFIPIINLIGLWAVALDLTQYRRTSNSTD